MSPTRRNHPGPCPTNESKYPVARMANIIQRRRIHLLLGVELVILSPNNTQLPAKEDEWFERRFLRPQRSGICMLHGVHDQFLLE